MHGLSKVIWPLVVFLTVSVWTTYSFVPNNEQKLLR